VIDRPSMRLAPLRKLQWRQSTWTFSAVLEPPHERGMTWSKWRFCREPQFRHLPQSRYRAKSRVSTLIDSVSLGTRSSSSGFRDEPSRNSRSFGDVIGASDTQRTPTKRSRIRIAPYAHAVRRGQGRDH